MVVTRSAEVVVVVVASLLLLAGEGSVVAEDVFTVLRIVEPFTVALLTLTTSTNVEVTPLAISGMEQVTVPVPPTGGVEQVQPGGADSDWNVVLVHAVDGAG